MKKKYFIIYSILFFIALFFLIYIYIYDSNTSVRQYSPDSATSWTNYTTRVHGDTVTLEGYIHADPGKVDTLAFFSVHQNVSIYCDNILIYKYPVENNNPFAVTPGYNWNFVSLPKSINKLIINFTSPYEGYAESIPIFYLGSTTGIFCQILDENVFTFLLCFIILCLGICMVGYWIYIRLHVPIQLNLLQLGIFAIFLSTWSANESRFTILLFRNNLVCSYLAFISLMLLPLPFALFVRSCYEDDHKIWDFFCTANVIQIFICLVLQFFKIADLRTTLWTTHVIMGILAIIVISSSIRLLKSRQNSDIVKIHILCISICTVTLAIDIIAFYLGAWDNNSFGRIGFLLYIVILGCYSVKESASLMKLGRKANTYQRLAFTDQMTKMSNRTAFTRDFEILSASPENIAVIIFDLNNLKQINDTLGHDMGDEYIISSAKIITNTFAHVGKCYRVGGDEFVVIIEQASHFDFRYYFNMMEWSIDSYNINQKDIHMQIAYGFATFDSSKDKSLQETYHRADKDMYTNKKEKKRTRS